MTLEVRGPDRQTWLGGVVTCEVASLRPGAGRYGLVLARNGKILSDTTIVVGADSLVLSVAAGRAEAVFDHLNRLLVMEDAELVEASSGWAWTFVLPAASDGAAVTASLGATDVRCHVAWPGIEGLAVVCDATETDARRAAWLCEHEDWTLADDPEVFERLRIEVGFPRFGVDFDASHGVHEASLDQAAVCWTKGCYVGQDIVARQHARGRPPRRLVSVRLEHGERPAAGSPVTFGSDDRVVGTVTSATHSERFGGAVAFARVASAQSEPATRVRVAGVPGVVGLSARGPAPSSGPGPTQD